MQFSPPSCHFIPLWSEYPPQHLVLKHPQQVKNSQYKSKLLILCGVTWAMYHTTIIFVSWQIRRNSDLSSSSNGFEIEFRYKANVGISVFQHLQIGSQTQQFSWVLLPTVVSLETFRSCMKVIRILRVLTIVYIRDHWVCGLRPSPRILNNLKEKHFEKWICFSLQVNKGRHLLCWVPAQWLRLALF
jgi:hypothetical protein